MSKLDACKPLCTDVRCDLPADHLGGCKSFEDEDFDDDAIGPCVDCGTQCVLDGSLAVLCPKCDALDESAES